MRKTACKNAKTLTNEQTATLKENAYGILCNARKSVLDRFPFIGSVAMSLDLVPVRDCRIPTMATDGQAIYCDIDFLNGLSADDKVFILAHEVYHNVMLHELRLEGRDKEQFNLATDMEVNNILRADGMSVPRDAVTSDKYGFPADRSAEEYYELLQANEAKFAKCSSNDSSASSSKSDDSDGNGSKNGNKDGQLSGQFDKHIYKDEQLEETGPEDKQDSYGKVGYDPDCRPNVTESAVEHIREAAVTAAQAIERQGGTVPGHIKQLVTKLLEPKLDWKELLAKFVIKSQGQKRTWNRPNKRFLSRNLYLPATYGEKMKVGIIIDTSGSVASYCTKFLSELNGLVKSFGEYNIELVQCDTRVQQHDSYSEESPLDLETAKYELKGFGGTTLLPAFKYLTDPENNCDIDCIVCLTDGEIADTLTNENRPDIPVMWCVTKDGTKDKLKWGEITDII